MSHRMDTKDLPCLNLCLFKWVNISLKRDNSFTGIGSWILSKKFSSFSVIIAFLKFLYRYCISTLKIEFIQFDSVIWKKYFTKAFYFGLNTF